MATERILAREKIFVGDFSHWSKSGFLKMDEILKMFEIFFTSLTYFSFLVFLLFFLNTTLWN